MESAKRKTRRVAPPGDTAWGGSQSKPARLGILGGTFNPVHAGHLFAAEFLREALQLDRVLFVPCGNPPHKRGDLLSPRHRCRMLRLALAGNELFSLSRIEAESQRVSYSIRTVRRLKTVYPRAELFFLIGADNISEIPTWRQYRDLLAECRFAAISRRPSRLKIRHPDLKNRILLVPAPTFEISSSEIRQRVEAGLSIRYMVPDPVLEYIHSHQLYRSLQGAHCRHPA